uniref:Integrase catalytic domain-containing protein n=1 Tax=Macrostomum lignano TaxID=282301 RepID=A0A1I8J7G3_9PLAT
MTIHWLHPDNQSRQHAVLAFMRLKGHHTATVLAEAIQSIHAKFNIEKKVCCTTTDNGSNFVKAFVEFGSATGIIPDPAILNVEADNQIDTVIVGNEGIEIEVDNETMPNEHAAEASKAFDSENPEQIEVPNATRWNSLFDSLSVLCDIFDKGKRLALNQSMEELRLQIPPFHVDDVAFLKEYVNVMKPVAHALDIIQGETYAYIGILLPTVVVTRSKLESMSQTELEYCSSLVLSLLDGINSRFERQFNNESCVLAAAFHPMFRLAWLRQYDTTTKASSIKKRMLQLIEVELDNQQQQQQP